METKRHTWVQSPVTFHIFVGEIKFENVSMKYRKHLDNALNNISIHIEPGEKIGVVGRTGSGKSTIIQTLFRLIEMHEGRIIIDGQDISEVGLH